MSEPNVPDSVATNAVRVLLIDDSKSARRATTNHLTAAGFTVINANDGFSALADVVEHRPHIILADIVMPRLDGYQTCALIKHNPDYRSIPVVLLSSRDGLFDRARGRLVGADAHLAKPFSDTELISTIRKCLKATAESAQESATQSARASETESGSTLGQSHATSPEPSHSNREEDVTSS